MQRRIKFTITGHGEGTDAPTVEDLLDQLRDYIDILKGVEEAASGSPASAIIWRVVGASRNSPLAFEVEPFSKVFATNIDQRVDLVMRETAIGLAALQRRPERPKYFTDATMKKAQRAFSRVTNGIARSGVDFGQGLPAVDLTATPARNAAQNVEVALARPNKPYRELGSVEGRLQSVERDGFGRRVAHMNDLVTGEPVKCILDGAAAKQLEAFEVRDVWRSIRVVISGVLFRAGGGSIDHIKADEVRELRPRSDLPQFDDIVDPDFTQGLTSVDYITRLRDGTLS